MNIKLNRYKNNPILERDYWWETMGVFNPAVIYSEGKWHMIYRALGGDRSSRFGYATSLDGVKWKKTSKYPVVDVDLDNPQERSGIEDPRIVKINNTFYITYIAASIFDAKEKAHISDANDTPWHVRVNLISTQDFKTFVRHGNILPDIDSKNATLFPEKISGKYGLLHRIKTDIYISFSQDIEKFTSGSLLMVRDASYWQSEKIGICSPPIKIKQGWLSIFHGVSKDKIYRAGFVVLDFDNPKKIIYRSKDPILSPYLSYERSGLVSNVVFPTGLVSHEGTLFIYYGAADQVIALAQIELEELENFIDREV